MPELAPADPDFEARIRASFVRQTAMATLGIRLLEVNPGQVVLELPWAAHLTQQHGFLHGGVIGAALDSACGYSASSLMAADVGVLSIEYKVSFLAPARGERFRVVGTVVKPGRTITFSEARAFAVEGGGEKLVATMSSTLMAVAGREDVKH